MPTSPDDGAPPSAGRAWARRLMTVGLMGAGLYLGAAVTTDVVAHAESHGVASPAASVVTADGSSAPAAVPARTVDGVRPGATGDGAAQPPAPASHRHLPAQPGEQPPAGAGHARGAGSATPPAPDPPTDDVTTPTGTALTTSVPVLPASAPSTTGGATATTVADPATVLPAVTVPVSAQGGTPGADVPPEQATGTVAATADPAAASEATTPDAASLGALPVAAHGSPPPVAEPPVGGVVRPSEPQTHVPRTVRPTQHREHARTQPPPASAGTSAVVPPLGTPSGHPPELPVAPQAPLPAPAPSTGLSTGSTVGAGDGSHKGAGGLPVVALTPAAEPVPSQPSATRAPAAAGSVGGTADQPSTRPD